MKTKTEQFKRGLDYPNEGFIQNAVEKYFDSLGYEQINVKYIDYVGINTQTEEKWVIETKGKTTEVGLDFRTCLGQLIQRMDDNNANYGIALPEILEYKEQCRMMKKWVVELLKINWLFVDENMAVRLISPGEKAW